MLYDLRFLSWPITRVSSDFFTEPAKGHREIRDHFFSRDVSSRVPYFLFVYVIRQIQRQPVSRKLLVLIHLKLIASRVDKLESSRCLIEYKL